MRRDVESIRQDFPILDQEIHPDRPLVYLDSAASAQRPNAVIQSMVDCYEKIYANVHRGIHSLSEQASEQYEKARGSISKLINATHHDEVIFTSGTTAGVNLVSQAWGERYLAPGDKIVLTIVEHHSNIVPWQQLAERKGATIEFVPLNSDSSLDLDAYAGLLDERTRMVAFSAVSNVIGHVAPVAQMVQMARDAGAHVLIDAAQHVPHGPTDIRQWDADFVVFSGHKMLGPSGIGVVWGRQELLEAMPPFLGGGGMISRVTVDGFTPGELPAKFEAGTPPIVEAIGLGVAANYLLEIGLQEISLHERVLTERARQALAQIDGLHLLGPARSDSSGIVSFTVDGLSNQDIAIFLDRQGVAVRAGHHCAMPLHDYLGIPNSCRASFYLYNTEQEVAMFAEALQRVIAKLR